MIENSDTILQKVNRLIDCHIEGLLGGEIMPEDENPGLAKSSACSYAYFTLPMALNYQRNSYTLWQNANHSYRDTETQVIFSPKAVKKLEPAVLRALLTKYKVALQPNKQPAIWQTLCTTFTDMFEGDIRNLFSYCGYSAQKTKQYLQQHKKLFPYLCGAKICNYWLYVMQNYTDLRFSDREAISVAPDTHVIQASLKLGLITQEQALKADVQTVVAARWEALLKGTGLQPIDVHTPLWLWSRSKFNIKL